MLKQLITEEKLQKKNLLQSAKSDLTPKGLRIHNVREYLFTHCL